MNRTKQIEIKKVIDDFFLDREILKEYYSVITDDCAGIPMCAIEVTKGRAFSSVLMLSILEFAKDNNLNADIYTIVDSSNVGVSVW